MNIELQYKQKIIHILTDIFPGVLIYGWEEKIKPEDLDGKQPDLHIALDLGRLIGHKDLMAAQLALDQTDIPYNIHLHDLQAITQQQFVQITNKQTPWKL